MLSRIDVKHTRVVACNLYDIHPPTRVFALPGGGEVAFVASARTLQIPSRYGII